MGSREGKKESSNISCRAWAVQLQGVRCEAGGGCVCLLSHVSVTDPIISARMTEFVTEV